MTSAETANTRRGITRRGFLLRTGGAVAGATALYVAPSITTLRIPAAYASITGPCVWAGIKKIDFEKYPLVGGGEAATVSGQHITDNFASWGVTVSTSRSGNGYPAMIFDSAHPTGHDSDLGTPTSASPYFGPGVGSGGVPGALGQNLNPLGKVLIISEDAGTPDPFSPPAYPAYPDPAWDGPDDHAGGGEIYFDFSLPTAVTYVDILDMDDGNSTKGSGRAKLWNGGTLVNNGPDPANHYKFPPLGNNSWQHIDIDPSDQVAITRLEIEFNSSGAVAEIGFKCP